MTTPGPAADPVGLALVAEACRKAGLIWLSYPGSHQPRPAWHVWHADAAHVLTARTDSPYTDSPYTDSPYTDSPHSSRTGLDEQPLPGLAELAASAPADGVVEVSCRAKDSRALLATWQARPTLVAPDSPRWDELVPLLRAARLNTPDTADAPRRWARTCALVRLEPTGVVAHGAAALPSDAGNAEPPDSPATTRGALPWVVHRRPTTRPDLNLLRRGGPSSGGPSTGGAEQSGP